MRAKAKIIIMAIILVAISVLCGCQSQGNDAVQIDSIVDNIRLLLERAPEYPGEYLPTYTNADIISYNYDAKTHSINTTSGTVDSTDKIANHYSSVLDAVQVDYRMEYNLESEYYAYGMIGNFAFMIEARVADEAIRGDYTHTITTSIHYLLGDELEIENKFRELKGTNAYIYTNPRIVMHQKMGDETGVYFALPLYKMQLIDTDYSLELYINNQLYTTRIHGDTIRVDIDDISNINDIKMIAYDDNNCIRALCIMDDLFMLDARDSFDISHITGHYSDTKALYMYNTSKITDISAISELTLLQELYITGNDQITDYTPILALENLQSLSLDRVESDIISQLSGLEHLTMLQLKNIDYAIDIDTLLESTNIRDIQILDCDNIELMTTLGNTDTLERVLVEGNNVIKLLQIGLLQPSIRVLQIDSCESFEDIVGTDNIINLNMIKISNCPRYIPTFPFDNLYNLGYIYIRDCPSLRSDNDISKTLFSNESLFGFDIINGYDGYSYTYDDIGDTGAGVQ